MLRVLLEIADLPDSPLTKLSRVMKWHIEFSASDIAELKKFMRIMDPMERLFSQGGIKLKEISKKAFVILGLFHVPFQRLKISFYYFEGLPPHPSSLEGMLEITDPDRRGLSG